MLQFLNNQVLQLQMTDNQMPAQQSKSVLSLFRLRPECKVPPVRVDFEAPLIPNKASVSIVPTFNSDRAYFTPSFLLPTDLKYFQQNCHFEKSQFEEKVQRCLQDTSSTNCLQSQEDILQAAPNSNFCQVCQEKFDDYHSHINLKLHRTRTQNSQTSALIQQFCLDLQTKQERDEQRGKTKGIRKDSRRQEKSLAPKKTNRNAKRQANQGESIVKSQNISTCLLQDSLRQFIE